MGLSFYELNAALFYLEIFFELEYLQKTYFGQFY